MRFDHLDQKAAPDVTADVVLMVLLTAKANHAAIDLLATALPVIDHRAMAKVVRHVMEKVGLHEKVKAVVLETAKVVLPKGVDANRGVAMVLRDRGLRAVQWDHRILNVSWKMRCVSMPTQMVS